MEILILEPLVPQVMEWLEERHNVVCKPELANDHSALRKGLYKAEAVVLPRKVVVTRAFLDFAPRLKAVARTHGQTDNTDLEACRERGVRVINASSASVRANAEYLLASLLLLYRRGLSDAMAGDRHASVRIGRELSGSTVGILGLAPTAHPLAMMLHSLGAKLIGYDPAVHHSSPMWERLQIKPVSLLDLMAHADAVSVQVMYASRFQGFINDNVLMHCKPGQLWAGVSRSQLFDPHSLARALADGRIEACMLDGAESGFASKGSPLHESNNLYLTPRLGSYTRESEVRASWYVAHRLHESTTQSSQSVYDQLMSAPMPLDERDPDFVIR